MTETQYIKHLRSLGLCEDTAENMARQAKILTEEPSAAGAVYSFAVWATETGEGHTFWWSFIGALYWAVEQDELDSKGVK